MFLGDDTWTKPCNPYNQIMRKPAATRLARRRVSSTPKVHGRGEARLDAMLELAEEACKPAPLGDVLGLLCTKIARVLSVDVCSIYLREVVDGEQPGRRRGQAVDRRGNADLVL